MNNLVKIFFLILLAILLFFLYVFLIVKVPEQKNITWGVNFSEAHAVFLKLDWKKTYISILDDLGVKNIKLITNWNWIQGEKDKFYFDNIDFQLEEAEKRNAKIIYVVGMKTGRWPECHLPDWAINLSKEEQQEEILEYIKEVILRYRDQTSIIYWQVENEPLYRFGICPWYDEDFLKKEVALVKSLDNTRPIIISDSGEQSLWIKAAKIGDVVGTTMYRRVWVHITDNLGFYMNMPFPSQGYWLKSQIISKFFGKKVINVELQAEPWLPNVFKEMPLKEQEKTMNLEQFRDNINYAKKSGFDTFYLWGAEWWYYMKEKHNKPEIWNEAKKYFITIQE